MNGSEIWEFIYHKLTSKGKPMRSQHNSLLGGFRNDVQTENQKDIKYN